MITSPSAASASIDLINEDVVDLAVITTTITAVAVQPSGSTICTTKMDDARAPPWLEIVAHRFARAPDHQCLAPALATGRDSIERIGLSIALDARSS